MKLLFNLWRKLVFFFLGQWIFYALPYGTIFCFINHIIGQRFLLIDQIPRCPFRKCRQCLCPGNLRDHLRTAGLKAASLLLGMVLIDQSHQMADVCICCINSHAAQHGKIFFRNPGCLRGRFLRLFFSFNGNVRFLCNLRKLFGVSHDLKPAYLSIGFFFPFCISSNKLLHCF